MCADGTSCNFNINKPADVMSRASSSANGCGMYRVFCISLLAVGALSQNLAGPIVDTSLGRAVGWERMSRDGRVYQAWTGIPFAQPPVGQLRFKAPKPAQKWSGVLNATGESPKCLQGRGVGTSEDCLYLSVYRPKNGMQQMPVVVHVHGGAFQAGGMGPRGNADYLMDEDVVLVEMQYRVNGIGFMSLGDKVMPGNFGIKDQVLALKWVQQDIASFGGDPNSVTLYGESAGAASTHFLLKTPAADSLVHRAVSDSGTVNSIWSLRRTEIVRNNTLNVADTVGCEIWRSNQEIFECLQKVDGAALLKAMGIKPTNNLMFAPCIEPEDAEDAVATYDISMRPVNKPWITSNTNGEYTLFKNMPTSQEIAEYQQNLNGYLEQFLKTFSKNSDSSRISEGAQLLKNYYFPVMEPVENFTVEIAEVSADMSFPFPSLYNLLMHQGPKWYYYFEYVSDQSHQTKMTGQQRKSDVAGHAEEVRYYFNLNSMHRGGFKKETPEDYRVSKRLIKYLVNFAYYDDPTPPGSPMKWDQFTGHEILRVTNSYRDFMDDGSVSQKLLNALNLWSYVIGWDS